MPGWTDARFVQQQFEALKKDVDQLKKSALPFTVQQKGPLPGYMRAVALNDRGMKGQMFMDFSNRGPGSGPYSAVTDVNGTIRAEWGNLAANGNSPTQFGFRANDATGTAIFDSLGLISVLNPTPTFIGPGIVGWTSVGTNTLTDGTTPYQVNFTAPRTCHYLVLGWIAASWTKGTSVNADWVLIIDVDNSGGSNSSPSLVIGTTLTTSPLIWVTSLTAGAHSIEVRSLDTGGGTGHGDVTNGWFVVCQMGS